MRIDSRNCWITGKREVIPQKKDCRPGLNRWRGGRYRVVDQENSGTIDIVSISFISVLSENGFRICLFADTDAAKFTRLSNEACAHD